MILIDSQKGYAFMDIGKRVKFLREIIGLSGRSLALKTGFDPSQINKIEHNVNKPSIDALEKICGVLGITLSEFFNEGPTTNYFPPDISEFAIDTKNRDLIHLVKGIKAAGYSNEVIQEWLISLMASLEAIRRKYLKETDTVVIAKDNPTPEELELVEKLKEKMKDPDFRKRLME